MIRPKLWPADFKEQTKNLAVKKMPAPNEVILPLSQHTGAPAQTKVSCGDKVSLGTEIARANGLVSSPVHSSVSGEVEAIETRPHPVLGEAEAIVIAADGQDSPDKAIKDRENPDSLSAEEIKKIIRDCGIVGLGGAAFPTPVKLSPPKDKHIDTFILNGAECEPYLTADERLMLEKPDEIISGMKLAMKALGVSQGIVAIEENKPEAIKLFKKLVEGSQIKVAALKSFYPQGAEKQLIKVILGREVPPQGLPFDVGVVVNNVGTSFAIYEAVYKNKPLYERVITVSGRIVKTPGNILVRIGTQLKDLIEFCGGLSEDAAKVISGGPMMGLAQYTLDAPVIKGTTGIIVFGKKELKKQLPGICIRCAKCLQVCPMRLNPSLIAQAIEKGRFDLAEEYHVLDCVECGICSYLCPGTRDFVGLVKLAKQVLKYQKSNIKNQIHKPNI